jgi:hypothetical protein
MVAECLECREVGRHRMVIEEAGYNLRQPFSLFGDWLMPAVSRDRISNNLGLKAEPDLKKYPG